MPWSPSQHRLFEWIAGNPGAAQAKGYTIPQQQAAKMAGEGIKRKALAQALRQTLYR